MSEGQKRGEEDKKKPGIWFLSLSLEPDLKALGTSNCRDHTLTLFVFTVHVYYWLFMFVFHA